MDISEIELNFLKMTMTRIGWKEIKENKEKDERRRKKTAKRQKRERRKGNVRISERKREEKKRQ